MDSPSTRPVNGCRESSMSVTSSSERRARLSRMVAVDVDDSESQTSSSCPTSSSSTSTTPTVQRTRIMPTLAIATVSGTPSQFQVPVRPVTATCRVRPLANVDWLGGEQRQAGTPTSLPGAAVMSASVVQKDRSSGLPVIPVREFGHKSAITVTPMTSRRSIRPTSTVPRSYDDDCAISVDDILMSDHDVAESKTTVYDNVQ